MIKYYQRHRTFIVDSRPHNNGLFSSVLINCVNKKT